MSKRTLYIRKSLICSLLSLFLITSLKSVAQENYKTLRLSFEKIENKQERVIISNRLLEASIKEFGKNSPEYLRSLNSVGYSYNTLGEEYNNPELNDTARLFWIRGIHEFISKPEEIYLTSLARICKNLSESYLFYKVDVDSANYYASIFIEKQNQIYGQNSKKMLEELSNLAWDFNSALNYEQSKKYFEQANEVRGKLFGKLSAEIHSGIDSILRTNQYTTSNRRFRHVIYTLSREQEPGKRIIKLDSIFPKLSDNVNENLKINGDSSMLFFSALYDLAVAYHEYYLDDQVAMYILKKGVLYLNKVPNKHFFLRNQFLKLVKIINISQSEKQTYLTQEKKIDYRISTKKIEDKPLKLVLPVAEFYSMFGEENVVFSPNGKRFLAFNATQVMLWDAEKAFLLASFRSTCGKVKFSPDGFYIISTCKNGQIWDATTGIEIMFKKPKETFSFLTLSPNGKLYATVKDSLIKIWDLKTAKLLKTIKGYNGDITNTYFSTDGEHLISEAERISVLYDLKTGLEIIDFNPSQGVKFSENGERIVTNYGAIMIWNAKEGLLLSVNYGVLGNDRFRVWSPDGNRLLLHSRKNSAYLMDVSNGEILNAINFDGENVKGGIFDTQGKQLATFSANTIKIVNIETGGAIQAFTMEEEIQSVAFTTDGKKIITQFENQSFHIQDIKSGQILIYKRLAVNNAYDNEKGFKFSPDGKNLHVLGSSWNLNSGQRTAYRFDDFMPDPTYKLEDSLINSLTSRDTTLNILVNSTRTNSDFPVRLSKDSTCILVIANDNSAKVIETKTGKEVFQLKHQLYLRDARYVADGKTILTYAYDGLIKFWDSKHGQLIRTIDTESPNGSLILSPTGKHFIFSAFGKGDRRSSLYEVATGKCINPALVENNEYLPVFSLDGEKIYTLESRVTNVFNSSDGRLLYRFVSVDKEDYIVINPAGFYLSTRPAAKLLYYTTPDLRVISFEQLDVKYNRPDRVLQSMGSTDTLLINFYKKTYEKRIKTLDIDTSYFKLGFNVPSAYFENRSTIAYQQTASTLNLKISSSDSKYPLARFNVWVNECPLFGKNGLSLESKNKRIFNTTLNIALSDGENKIETSVVNKNGVESYREPIFVNYTPAVPYTPKMIFAGIGIDHFKENGHDLSWSVKDIRDLALNFKLKYGDLATIDTLFNQNVSTNTIDALKEKLARANVNDKVIIAYSGHGILDQNFDYFLSTYAVDFSKPENFGLRYDSLEILLEKTKSRNKLLLLDACHSGEVDKEEMKRITDTAPDLAKVSNITYKGVSVKNLTVNKNKNKSSFELMQEMFVNVGKSNGTTIISAATGTQFALEKNDLKNGVFTFSILELLQQKSHIKVSELKQEVNKRVIELTKGLQTPTSRSENTFAKWLVW